MRSNLLLFGAIRKPISGMEYGQVVDVLHVALLEVRVHTELVAEEMQCV